MSARPAEAASAALPPWLAALAQACASLTAGELSRFGPPADGGARESAVLILFGTGAQGVDVLLIRRSLQLRDHAGQVAFPGGGAEPGDSGPVATALREAAEETGLDPAGVDVLATLPAVWLPPSNHAVTPVLGWWRQPSAVGACDAIEVAAVVRVPLAELTDPARRGTVRHANGFVGPAFDLPELFVWGFTAGLLSQLLDLAGMARPWDVDRLLELPPGAGPVIQVASDE